MLEAHNSLIAILDDELEREHGLSLHSYEVLVHLGEAPEGLRMSELAKRLLLSRSGVSRLVDRLERRDLVRRKRCDDDGRGLFARLTPAGAEKLAAMRPAHLDGVRRHFLSRLSDTELRTLATIWPKLLPRGENGGPRLDESC
jgi:DNA-binding MarR family transcriptional regulator